MEMCPLFLNPAGWLRYIISSMALRADESYLTLPLLQDIPFLVHGFGMKDWSLGDLRKAWDRFGIVTLRQVHSDRVVFLDAVPASPPRADGLVTASPFLLLVVKTADCLPLLLADPDRKAVAAVHCGWRGTSLGIAGNAVRVLRDRFGCDPGSLRAGLGPLIGASCYEVGEDVRTAFSQNSLPLDVFQRHPLRQSKYFLDLEAANVFQLRQAGLREKSIGRSGLCTHCQTDLCSYRRQPSNPGRMINFIGLDAS